MQRKARPMSSRRAVSIRRCAASLEGYSDDDVFARLQQLRSRHDQDSSLPPKLAEFDVFASGEPTIGDNQPGSLLYAETLERGLWDTDNDAVVRPIGSLVAVHR